MIVVNDKPTAQETSTTFPVPFLNHESGSGVGITGHEAEPSGPSKMGAPITPMSTGTLSQPPPYESSSSSSSRHLRPETSYAQQPLSSPRAFAPSPLPEVDIAHSAVNTGPPSFSRLPSQEPGYPSFPPMYLIASGKHITKGFPAVPPPSSIEYHPFTTHDVMQEDWLRFITDLNQVAQLSEKDRWQADNLPVLSWVPYVNTVASLTFKAYVKKRREKPVSDRIYEWNHYFFHPRRMDVILMRGQQKIGKSHLNSKREDRSCDKERSRCSNRDEDDGDNTYRLWIKPLET